MEWLKKLNIQPGQIAKILGGVVVVIVILALIATMLDLRGGYTRTTKMTSDSVGAPGMLGMMDGVAFGGAMQESASLSVRNVVGDDSDYAIGSDAENFEVTQYRATIETRMLDHDCTIVRDLKAREDVIFENSNEYDHGCSYTFKIARDSVDEILTIIEALDPEELSEQTYTIKQQIEDYTSEVALLQKQLDSIESTLQNAVTAYDEITTIASTINDAETLAKIIDSKLGVIERLTQQQITINARLDRIERAKAQELDRLNYTYMYVSITEDTFVDGEQIRDSWKRAVRMFIQEINTIAQDLTVNLVSLVLHVLQYALYLLILVFVVKYGWRIVKQIWEK